jgi:hypothetical protein
MGVLIILPRRLALERGKEPVYGACGTSRALKITPQKSFNIPYK